MHPENSMYFNVNEEGTRIEFRISPQDEWITLEKWQVDVMVEQIKEITGFMADVFREAAIAAAKTFAAYQAAMDAIPIEPPKKASWMDIDARNQKRARRR